MQTRIGTLKFSDGLPDADTVKKVYDNLDFVRGVEAFLLGIPAANVQGLRRGYVEGGFPPNQGFGISEGLADARSLFLTPNTVVVYTWGTSTSRTGRWSCRCRPARWASLTTPTSASSPTSGLPARPGQGRQIPGRAAGLQGHAAQARGYFVQNTRTYSHNVIMRAFIQGSDAATIVKNVKANTKMYPLSAAANPPTAEVRELLGHADQHGPRQRCHLLRRAERSRPARA